MEEANRKAANKEKMKAKKQRAIAEQKEKLQRVVQKAVTERKPFFSPRFFIFFPTKITVSPDPPLFPPSQ